MIPGAFPVMAGDNSRIPATTVYDTSILNSTAAVTQTFSSIAIGSVNSAAATARSVSSNRQVFVACAAGSVVTSLTVGGVSASLVVSSTYTKLYRAAVPTGTTATIVVSQSSSSAQAIAVWTTYDLISTTPFDTSTSSGISNGSFTHTINLNTDVDGTVVGYGIIGGSPLTPTLSWSGLTEDGRISLATDIYAAASFDTPTASTPRSVSVTTVGGVGNVTAAIAASFS